MIKFFRQIRFKLMETGKTSRYLKYAIGEIVLVVIGILIALQVNNYNTERKVHKQEIDLLKDLKLDLEIADQKNKKQISWFKESQDIHYQIYKESIGEASFDSTMRYHDLIWTAIIRDVISENYTSRLHELSDERLERILRDYLWREQLVIDATNEWNDVKLNKIRPFLDQKGLYRTEIAFNDEPYEFMSIGKDGILLDYGKLKELYGTEEFDQLLYYLRHSAAWCLHCMGKLEEANVNLNLALDSYIEGDYDKLDDIKPLEGYY